MAKTTIIIITSMSVKPWLLLSMFLSFRNDFISNIFSRNRTGWFFKTINDDLLIISTADKNNLTKSLFSPGLKFSKITPI